MPYFIRKCHEALWYIRNRIKWGSYCPDCGRNVLEDLEDGAELKCRGCGARLRIVPLHGGWLWLQNGSWISAFLLIALPAMAAAVMLKKVFSVLDRPVPFWGVIIMLAVFGGIMFLKLARLFFSNYSEVKKVPALPDNVKR